MNKFIYCSLFLIILYYLLKINNESFVGYGGNSNPPGYQHRWHDWNGPWGFPWLECNPLKKYNKPIINWYWY
jgi:hypothetical protein